MPNRLLLISWLILVIFGCQAPITDPSKEAPIRTAQTANAGRLALTPQSIRPPIELLLNPPRKGFAEIRLSVDSTGKVTNITRIAGSSQTLLALRGMVLGFKFVPKDPTDSGPWAVDMVIQTGSSGGSPGIGGLQTGDNLPSSSFKLNILDVNNLEIISK